METILEKINQNNPTPFDYVFNKTIEIFKKVWVEGLLFVVTYFVAIAAFLGLFILMLFLFGITIKTIPDFTALNLVTIIIFLLTLFLFIPVLSTLITGLFCGFYKVVYKLDHNEAFKFSDFFTFLKGNYLLKTFKLSLAIFGIGLLAYILCFIPIIYAAIPLSYMTVIYAFNPHLKTAEIVNLGFKLGNNKWFITFGCSILFSILSQIIGLLLCGVGIFVLISINFLPRYAIYKEVIGFGEEEIEEIGEGTNF